MNRERGEWCIVQKDGIRQSSTHRHLDAESAVDKGWGTVSTTEKDHFHQYRLTIHLLSMSMHMLKALISGQSVKMSVMFTNRT